jgi:hypothetical protein
MGTFLLLSVGSGVFGAVIAVLAWATFRRGMRRPSGLVLFVTGLLSAIVFYTVVQRVFLGPDGRGGLETAGLALYGNKASADRYAEVMAPLVSDPRMRARMRSVRGSVAERAAFEAVTHEGLARLDDHERESLFEIKRGLAARSPEICAGFWTGKLANETLQGAVRRLGEADQRTWIDLSARALALGLEPSPPPRVGVAERDKALGELSAALSGDVQAGFNKALKADAATLTQDDACAGFMALASGVKLLSPPSRQILLRAVTNPELVGGP